MFNPSLSFQVIAWSLGCVPVVEDSFARIPLVHNSVQLLERHLAEQVSWLTQEHSHS